MLLVAEPSLQYGTFVIGCCESPGLLIAYKSANTFEVQFPIWQGLVACTYKLWKLRKEDHELEISLSYIVTLCLKGKKEFSDNKIYSLKMFNSGFSTR